MKRHPFDAVSFASGVILLAAGLLVFAGETPRLFGAWLGPAVIVGLGVVLLVAGWRSSRTDAVTREEA